jgi:hypothetical protein
MTNLHDLTTSQLNRIIAIKEQIETLQGEIESIAGDGGEVPSPFPEDTPRKRRRSGCRPGKNGGGSESPLGQD